MGRSGRWVGLFVLLGVFGVAGCYTEVPYDESAERGPNDDVETDVELPPPPETAEAFEPIPAEALPEPPADVAPLPLAEVDLPTDVADTDPAPGGLTDIPEVELDTEISKDDELFAAALRAAGDQGDDATTAALAATDEAEQPADSATETAEEPPLATDDAGDVEVILPEIDTPDFGEPVIEPFELADKPLVVADSRPRLEPDVGAEPDVNEPVAALDTVETETVEPSLPAEDSAATLAAASSAVERPSAVAPAPADPTTVSPTNTRHVAWLLGVKLSFAMLAPQDEDSTSTALQEAQQLAEVLDVTWDSPDGPATVSETLAVGRDIGRQLSDEYSADHAALVEIAFKTTILLAVFDEHRELAHPIVGATAAACVRAGVSEPEWQSWQQQVIEAEQDVAVRDAVNQLHQAIERMLTAPRESGDSLFR